MFLKGLYYSASARWDGGLFFLLRLLSEGKNKFINWHDAKISSLGRSTIFLNGDAGFLFCTFSLRRFVCETIQQLHVIVSAVELYCCNVRDWIFFSFAFCKKTPKIITCTFSPNTSWRIPNLIPSPWHVSFQDAGLLLTFSALSAFFIIPLCNQYVRSDPIVYEKDEGLFLCSSLPQQFHPVPGNLFPEVLGSFYLLHFIAYLFHWKSRKVCKNSRKKRKQHRGR